MLKLTLKPSPRESTRVRCSNSLKGLDHSSWKCTRKKPGPTRRIRHHYWEVHEERVWTSIRTLSGWGLPGNRKISTEALRVGTTHHCHLWLQRQALATSSRPETDARPHPCGPRRAQTDPATSNSFSRTQALPSWHRETWIDLATGNYAREPQDLPMLSWDGVDSFRD